MNIETPNDKLFSVIPLKDRQNILQLLINDSLFREEPNDLYWLEVSEALLRLSISKASHLCFLSQGLDTPKNQNIQIVEKPITVANANDIGISIINDLQRFLINEEEKSDALVISCPSLAAIFLISEKLRFLLGKLCGGNLIITINVTLQDRRNEITVEHGNLVFSELHVRRLLHQKGFKRIRCTDCFESSASWKHESKEIVFEEGNVKPSNSEIEAPNSFYMKTYVCDMGMRNV